ncbi:MAG: hypothetical protein JW957_02495 [Candidatus Omnitrophica bacterium]|nr:hypothetical protein [Candidatus Omnitrophota bacterium]
MDKLIKKVIEDAEKKAEGIIGKAKETLNEKFAAEKENIEKEYEGKLRDAKNRIDKESEIRLSRFRMDKEKELLALKNSFIEEVLKVEEKKFNEYLNKNMKDIIVSACRELGGKNYTVKIPESAEDMAEIKDVKIEKDKTLRDAFIISAEKWSIVFNWEHIRVMMEDELKEKAGKYLFNVKNGQKNTGN